MESQLQLAPLLTRSPGTYIHTYFIYLLRGTKISMYPYVGINTLSPSHMITCNWWWCLGWASQHEAIESHTFVIARAYHQQASYKKASLSVLSSRGTNLHLVSEISAIRYSTSSSPSNWLLSWNNTTKIENYERYVDLLTRRLVGRVERVVFSIFPPPVRVPNVIFSAFG